MSFAPGTISQQRFGRWLVLSYAGKSMWLCRCNCGTQKVVFTNHLKTGRSKGCTKCMHGTVSNFNAKHRMSATRLYRKWSSMKARCASDPDYAGRGIAVCEEWQKFTTFRDWALVNGYRDGLWIERRDNDGNYEPGNCRWATGLEQVRNRRVTVRCNIDGQDVVLSEAIEGTGISYSLAWHRIKTLGWSAKEAITVPPHQARGA